MPPHIRHRAGVALLAIAGLYILARTAHWTGPHPGVDFEPSILGPSVIMISLWGLFRLWQNDGGHAS